MDMILLDWTRMNRVYCLAGVIWQGEQWRVVRPLLAHRRNNAERNTGWSPFLMDGHQRWELFELVNPEPALPPEAPHLEDIWVRSLSSRKRLAKPEVRSDILQATCPPEEQKLFGAPLRARGSAGFLPAGQGCRSLVSTVVAAEDISFRLVWKDGQARYRVHLETPELASFQIPVTDHTLLSRAEQQCEQPEERLTWMTETVHQMGEKVVVRLGVSRPFAGATEASEAVCWLMADGFFAPTAPQP